MRCSVEALVLVLSAKLLVFALSEGLLVKV